MDAMELNRMIVRWLLGEATEEEVRGLEEWKRGAEERGRLLERLAEGEFLRKAVEEDNRVLRRRVWEGVEKRVERGSVLESVFGSGEGLVQGGERGGKEAGGRKRSVGWLGWWRGVVAVLLPVALAGAVWLLWGDGGDGVKGRAEEVAQRIEAGSAKAVVELAGGERVFLVKDTVVDVQGAGVALVNRRDTLRLTGLGAGGYGGVEKGGEGRRFHVVRIPRGGEYIAELGDGSVVHLNSASVLRVPVDFGRDGKREVWLEGEGCFDVTKREGVSFVVKAGSVEVKVLGTLFNVEAYGDEEEVRTTLVRGQVEVGAGGRRELLKPDRQAVVDKAGGMVVREVYAEEYVAWTRGEFVFTRMRLEEVMGKLARWYDVEVFFGSDALKDVRFTLSMQRYEDIREVLSKIEKTGRVHFLVNGRSVLVE